MRQSVYSAERSSGEKVYRMGLLSRGRTPERFMLRIESTTLGLFLYMTGILRRLTSCLVCR
jgi:hypothetical protein